LLKLLRAALRTLPWRLMGELRYPVAPGVLNLVTRWRIAGESDADPMCACIAYIPTPAYLTLVTAEAGTT